MSVAMNNLEELLKTRWRLITTSCNSLRFFETIMEREAPSDWSIFKWEPMSLNCIRYVSQAKNEPTVVSDSMRAVWNKKHEAINKEGVDVETVFDLVQRSITLAESEREGRKDYVIPPKSLILLVNPLEEFTSPILRTKFQKVTSYPGFGNYQVAFVVYSDNPITNRFLLQHGIGYDLPPWSEKEIQEYLENIKTSIGTVKSKTMFISQKPVIDGLVPSLMGMTPDVAEHVIKYGFLKHIDATEPTPITDYADRVQARIISQSDMLSFLPVEKQINPKFIGGFDNFLEFMQESAIGFSPEARKLNLEPPRGVVLLGLPGTGKSMAAKALGHILSLRTVIMDMSSAFGSLVGESESKIRKALQQVEAFGRCVLLIDEADKAFAGATGAVGDSGTTRRVLGTLLTWLQEQRKEIYVVLTMNSIETIPPEFLRAGRFDKVFYTDLPDEEDRINILQLQFARRGIEDLDLTDKEWQRLADATEDFTGAELEEVVRESQRLAFKDRKDSRPTFDDIYAKAISRVPMAKFDKERIQAIRNFCHDRATPVSKRVVQKLTLENKNLERVRYEE